MRRSLQSPPAAAEVTPQQQLDLELLTALHKAGRFLRWRALQIPGNLYRAIPGRRLLTNTGLVLGMIALAWYSPLNDWAKSGLHALAQNVKARAAFQVIDDFAGGISENWDAARMVSESGAARVTGFALNRSTMKLAGYRMDFDAKIAARGLGWVIGAADERNYYAFKLEDVSSKKERKYRLVRYLVVGGAVVDSERVNVEVPVPLNQEDFNRISVRLRENRIATFINGTGVDYWQAEEAPHGGIGFFTENNESALVRRVEVSGNGDTWGLFLFGFLELIEDAKDFVEPVTANSHSTSLAASSGKPTEPSSLAALF